MLQTRTSDISEQINNGEPVKLAFHYNTKEINKFLNSIFVKVLSKNDLDYLHGMVETILREMIINAVKANSKRVFFKLKSLDIQNESDYNTGMEDFKSYFINDDNGLADELKEQGYRVELCMKKSSDGFRIMVRNNAPLLPFENERIRERIEKARQYNDFGEIYMDIADDSEGEGLGIPLTVLFLKNSGIGDQSFTIRSDGKITQSEFMIPSSIQPSEIVTDIKTHIAMEINDLPTFPENIIRLQQLCRNKDVTIDELTRGIQTDPALSASILKLANSAGFITARRINSLKDAIKIIGLKNLNSMLMATAARQILDTRFSSFKEIWSHCNKSAFYARCIANKFNLASISEMAYLASLLHDLGKIILLSANTELTTRIESVAIKRQMRRSTVLEEMSMGISHSSIGRIISEKWNFPPYIVEAIAYHHSPLSARDEFKDIVYITYMANTLCLIEDKKFDYFYMEDEVLRRFGLTDRDKFIKFHDELIEKASAAPEL